MEKLIPYKNFSVRKVQIKVMPKNRNNENTYIVSEGYAIWSNLDAGYITFNNVIQGIKVPNLSKKKSIAMLKIKDGLYEGYQFVDPISKYLIVTVIR